MEQTAIQEMIDIIQMDMNNGVEISMNVFMGMLKKAKEKEKKQSIDFACEVMFGTKDGDINLRNHVISKYNETFKSE